VTASNAHANLQVCGIARQVECTLWTKLALASRLRCRVKFARNHSILRYPTFHDTPTQLNALSICSIFMVQSALPVPATSIHVCRLLFWPVFRCRRFDEFRTLSECLLSIKNVVGGEPSYEDLRKNKCLRVYSGFFAPSTPVLLLRVECSMQFARVFLAKFPMLSDLKGKRSTMTMHKVDSSNGLLYTRTPLV